MPRRRGEYTLTKSTSFAVFPVTNSIDKDYCSTNNAAQGTCKAKVRLNLTISGSPSDYNFLNNDAYEESPPAKEPRQQKQQQQQSKNSYRRELFQLFSRDFSKDRVSHRTHLYIRNGSQCRTTSHDSSFRSPLKCPLEMIKLRATNKKQTKQDVTPPVKVLSFVNLMPEMVVASHQNVSVGKNLWNKSRKVHKSKSDAFVNSQEWTLSRGVVELKLGLVGSLHSGKTALVHRYLTGAYTNEESPEGGRFKKEVVLDGQSYLLLIRDEGSTAPDYQFAQWVDAVIFVFSLESQESIETALRYYEQMAKYRNMNEIPLMMVGTQDAVTESNPRVINEQEGRQMAKNLPKCSAYYEACSTYGLNVDRIFKDACQKIIHKRLLLLSGFSSSARTPTPTTPSTLHSNSSGDHRNSNYQDLGYSNGYNSKGTPYNHQRSVSALPLQEHSQQQHQQTSSAGRHGNGIHCAAQIPSSYAYHRESSTLNAAVRGAGTERSMSAFVMPSITAPPHLNKVHRTSQYSGTGMNATTGGCPAAPSPAHSSSSVMSTNNGAGHCQCSPRASTIHHQAAAQTITDQALFLKDEVFDNPIQAPSGPTTSHLLTPSSTPTTQRRNRRISNLFQRPKDHGHDEKSHRSTIDINMGMGRAIPVKQGHLYKRSSKTLNKEWKKKYVCLHSDGRLSYHQSLKDYMEKDANGKEVFLGLATVRIAGRQRPRNTQRAQTQVITGSSRDFQILKDASCKRESLDPNIARHAVGISNMSDTSVSAGQENKAFTDEQCTNGEGTSGASDDQQQNAQQLATSTSSSVVTVHASFPTSANKKKKGHRRLGSAAKNEEEEDCEFEIVTCDQKRWEFSATSVEERDEWVAAIEELIEKSLQAQMSQKQQSSSRAHGNKAEVQALRLLSGNDSCADCGAPKPDWASLNLGTLICIECSGIHRNLGSHISKVRSLDLDDWPVEYLNVMEAIGNEKANAVWEYNAPPGKKPQSGSSREEKEKWIKLKYEGKRFLPPVAADQPIGRQLLDAVFNNDLNALLPILPRCSVTDLRTTVNSSDKRTALHIACSNASAACTQLLVWYNADLRMLDDMGRSALWHAQTSGALDCAAILLNAGLDPKHGIPDSAEVIMGSLSSRDFCSPGDKLLTSDAKLRRQSDIVIRRIAPGGQQQPHQQQHGATTVNSFHQRSSDAFERLPASVI